MKQRWLPVTLLIAFVAMVWCGLIAPSHACCVAEPGASIAAAPSDDTPAMPSLAACCQTKAMVFSGSDWQDAPAKALGSVASAAPLLLTWLKPVDHHRHVIEQSAFVKDDSRRHLELSVLLN